MLNTKNSHLCEEEFAPLRRRKPKYCRLSNHNGAEQEMFSEQERFVRTEITFTLRKNGPAVWVVGRFLWSGRLADENLVVLKKSCNSPSKLFSNV